MKIRIPTLIIVWLACFAFLPKGHAVNPPPDGGYPGGNTAEGQLALGSLTTGIYNSAIGIYSLLSLTDGNFCTGAGAATLLVNTADENTATGAGALLSNTIGAANTANGAFALFFNTEGSSNTAVGNRALFSNTLGNNNTALGTGALGDSMSGGGNTALGYFALSNSTGTGNVGIGTNAGMLVSAASNVIVIGAGVNGEDVSNSCYIGNIFDATSSAGVGVFINSNGKLGTNTSSARFKDDIKPMGKGSEALFSLKPVAFRYNKEIDPEGKGQFGLIAEEVEKVNPDLIVRDKEGKPYTVRYDQVNAMLLNEFLKEHRKVQDLEKGMAALTARLDEQAAQMQRIRAQVELNKPAAQTVGNQK